MTLTNDPVERIVLKIIIVFITAIFIVFVVKPALGLFGVMSQTGDPLTDTLMFFIVPVAIAFICIYRIFKVFAA